MAKRLTDSEKWKDPFFEGLSKELKLAWIFLLDDCNHAGIWSKSIKRLNLNLDTNFTEEDILKAFGNRIVILNTEKWFIPKFVTFQYGKEFINSKQKSVLSAVKILDENGLIKALPNGYLTLNISLPNPMVTLSEPLPKGYDSLMVKNKDMAMVKDMDNDIVKELDNVKDKSLEMKLDKSMEEYKMKSFEEMFNSGANVDAETFLKS